MCAVVSNSNNLKILLICLYMLNDDNWDVTHQINGDILNELPSLINPYQNQNI